MAEHSALPSLNERTFFSKRLLAENFKKKSLWNRVTYKALSGKLRNKELYRCLLSLLYSRELEQFHKLWKPVTHSTRVPTKICRAPYHRGRHRDEVLPSFSFSSGSEGLWWPNKKSNFAFFPYCFNICTCIFFWRVLWMVSDQNRHVHSLKCLTISILRDISGRSFSIKLDYYK